MLIPLWPRLFLHRALLPGLGMSGILFPPVGAGGLPILGSLSPFQFGSAPIDPGELFFTHGHPVGGPSESFRGVRASVVPFYASILGSGAPLSPGAVGIAGAPLSSTPGL